MVGFQILLVNPDYKTTWGTVTWNIFFFLGNTIAKMQVSIPLIFFLK